MNGKNKGWLIAATLLVIVGTAVFAGAMQYLKWDFKKLNTVHYETKVYDITKKFDDISIFTSITDVTFELASDGECKVVCREAANMPHSVLVKDDTLEITWTDNRTLTDHIVIEGEETEITIYLPHAEYDALCIEETTGDIVISEAFIFKSIEIHTSTGDVECYASAEDGFITETDTGDIKAENISTDTMELFTTTGHITLGNIDCSGTVQISVSTGESNISGVRCESFITNGGAGDITLTDVIAEGVFSVERTTGDVVFDSCDAAEIFVRTDTGDVKGSLLSEKYYVVNTDTGDVNVPKTMGGGKCEIITDTGDVEMTEV